MAKAVKISQEFLLKIINDTNTIIAQLSELENSTRNMMNITEETISGSSLKVLIEEMEVLRKGSSNAANLYFQELNEVLSKMERILSQDAITTLRSKQNNIKEALESRKKLKTK